MNVQSSAKTSARQLSRAEIEEYLVSTRGMSELWQRLRNDDDWQNLLRSPESLAILCDIVENGSSIAALPSANLHNLVEAYVDQLYARAAARHRLPFTLSRTRALLARLAAKSWEDNKLGSHLWSWKERWARILCDRFWPLSPRFLRFAASLGLITANRGMAAEYRYEAVRDVYAVSYFMSVATGKIFGTREYRHDAVYLLGIIGSPIAVPALVGILQDINSPLHRIAADSLGKIGDSTAIPALNAKLTHESWWIRSAAAIALGEIGDLTTIPAVAALLNDEQTDVRYCAAEALGKFHHPDAVTVLVREVHNKSSVIRHHAIHELAESRDRSLIPLYLQALKEEDPFVRDAAAVGLYLLGEQDAEACVAEYLGRRETFAIKLNLYRLGFFLMRFEATSEVGLTGRYFNDGEWNRHESSLLLRIAGDSAQYDLYAEGDTEILRLSRWFSTCWSLEYANFSPANVDLVLTHRNVPKEGSLIGPG